MRVKHQKNKLIVYQSILSLIIELGGAAILFLISLLVYLIPENQVKIVGDWFYIIYALPLFTFPKLIKKLYQVFKGYKLVFDKSVNRLFINGKQITSLGEIKRLEFIPDKVNEDANTMNLVLVTNEKKIIQVAKCVATFPGMQKTVGIEIAKFLGISFYNNYYSCDELIYNGRKVNTSLINAVSEDY